MSNNLSIIQRAQFGDQFHDLNIFDARSVLPSIGNDPYSPKVKSMLHIYDLIGIKTAALVSNDAISVDSLLGNRDVETMINAYPGRFVGWFGFNPNILDLTTDVLEEWMSKPDFIGFKLQPNYNKYPATGSGYTHMWETASKWKVPVLSHTWDRNRFCDPNLFAEIADCYPDVHVVMAHAGGTRHGYQKSVKLASERENLYLELCRVDFAFGQIEYYVKELGSKKIIFGSDFAYEYIDIRPVLGNVLFSRIDDEEKKNLLGNNFRNLLSTKRH